MPGRERAPPPRMGASASTLLSGQPGPCQAFPHMLSMGGSPSQPRDPICPRSLPTSLLQVGSLRPTWRCPSDPSPCTSSAPRAPVGPALPPHSPGPPHTSFQEAVCTGIQKYNILNHLRFFVQDLLVKIIFIQALTYPPYLIHSLVK